MLIRTVALMAVVPAALFAAGAAAAETPLAQGPPVTSGGDGTMVLHCNALGLTDFVGAIVINRNGEFGSCRFVH